MVDRKKAGRRWGEEFERGRMRGRMDHIKKDTEQWQKIEKEIK